MAEKKVTQKDLYERIKGRMADDAEVVAFCNKKLEQIANKATSGNSKKNAEHEKMFDAIAEVLNGSEGMRATEIFNALTANGVECSVQKVTAMLKKMVENGEVVKTVEKKVATFALAPITADSAEG